MGSLDFIDAGIGFIVKTLGFVKDLIVNISPGAENIILLVSAGILTFLFTKSELFKKPNYKLSILVGAILFLLLKLL